MTTVPVFVERVLSLLGVVVGDDEPPYRGVGAAVPLRRCRCFVASVPLSWVVVAAVLGRCR